MKEHHVRVQRAGEVLAREEQLAWQLARVATDAVDVEDAVAEMLINRVIDNAAVAAASLRRRPVENARAQALRHPAAPGANLFGVPRPSRVGPAWAAWANGVAVRELDFHDTFLAAEYAHPGDNIPPILAVAQHCGRDGRSVIRALATAYEIQVDLAKGICLHEHKIDHIAHLGPSMAAGIGTLLRQPIEVVYQAIQQALHTTTTTRQSRKGEISSWKAYAPAFAGQMAILAVDRAMRGERSPSPIYEGTDAVIARLLDGPDAEYRVPLPEPGEPKRAVLETYTKEHSAEYQAQAWIDLAKRLRKRIPDLDDVRDITIHTSHHTHVVIGTGSGDPQKFDPRASRETLDHSLMYIVAVALQDGSWHHERSYLPERAARLDTVSLWRKIKTVEDPEWTARYHAADSRKKAFGGRIVVEMNDGSRISDEIAVADAHPEGARPFGRAQYIEKFETLSEGVVTDAERRRFLDVVQDLAALSASDLAGLFFEAADPLALESPASPEGIF